MVRKRKGPSPLERLDELIANRPSFVEKRKVQLTVKQSTEARIRYEEVLSQSEALCALFLDRVMKKRDRHLKLLGGEC